MAGRIRTVKPEIFFHELLADLNEYVSPYCGYFFIGLFTQCDRDGKFRWVSRRLKAQIFPYQDIDVDLILNSLWENGFIKKYSVDEKEYGFIPSWADHQSINNRESDSKIPEFTKNNELKPRVPTREKEESTRADAPLHASLHASARDLCMHKGKGREGKGKEGKDILVENQDSRRVSVQKNNKVKNENIELIFEHWKRVMGHEKSKLDTNRKRIISRAMLLGYTVEQILAAIDGCSKTPHNMGVNESAQRYDGIHLILRNADQIDRFIKNSENKNNFRTSGSLKSETTAKTILSVITKNKNLQMQDALNQNGEIENDTENNRERIGNFLNENV